jgi:hypothetical protein
MTISTSNKNMPIPLIRNFDFGLELPLVWDLLFIAICTALLHS